MDEELLKSVEGLPGCKVKLPGLPTDRRVFPRFWTVEQRWRGEFVPLRRVLIVHGVGDDCRTQATIVGRPSQGSGLATMLSGWES